VSELPKSWVVTRLGDFAYVKNGFAFKSKHYVLTDTNTVPVIRISDIQNEKAVIDKATHVHKDNAQPDFLIVKDDLLIAMSGATTGKTGVYKSDVVAYQNQRVGNIKLHSKLLGSNTYKNYLIASLSEEILKKAYGAAQPNISGKSIEDILVAIAPLNEQIRIADKLDSMLAKVDAAQARLDKIPNILKRFRQSVLAAATSGELTKEWREENQVIFNWDEINVSEIVSKI
jgi:type I restriction enzyme S subunit